MEIDSIDFNDELKYKRSITYTADRAIQSIEYKAINGNLKKIDFYGTKNRVVKDQIWQNKLLQEIKYTYLEKGQVVKRVDVLNKVDLPTMVNVNIKYPAMARENNIAGKIVVGFNYNEDCLPIDFKVLNSLGHGIDEEVMEKMKLMIALSRKYNVSAEDCREIVEPFVINFSLE